jgi:hypothetical protein
MHHKHDKCLLICDGAELPAREPNMNHNGRYVVSECFVHEGSTSKWRGSAGCCTLPPDKWESFIKEFFVGEKGELIIADYSKMKEAA